jgi:HD superfamily phosphohydrolase
MPEKNLKTINEYDVLNYIASGTYADSYLVQKQNSIHHVLKLMHSGIDATGPKRFKNEEDALKKLGRHKGVPNYIDSGIYDNRPYIVMAFAKGSTLGNILSQSADSGNAVGYITVMTIVEQLLDILKFAHSKKLNHRDIKLDNVIYDSKTSLVTLIDFGFSKADFFKYQELTWWNVGAARYSPPSKIEHPSITKNSHDVFAVGVLAYKLLTNKFPWSVSEKNDPGHLKKDMLEKKPTSVKQINSLIPQSFSDYVLSLIDINDDARLSVRTAITKLKKVRESIEHDIKKSRKNVNHSIYSRVIRCAVHGDINFSEYEWRLINSKEFNRLRNLKQLGTTNLVYPGATHSRFSHALGAVHCASKILDSLENIGGDPITESERMIVRLYALMHDITHIAYGHTLEDELNIFDRHDKNMDRLVRLLFSDKSTVGENLRSSEEGRIVLELLNPELENKDFAWAREIVTSPIGADVLDYIDRDSINCGLDHRVDSAIYRRFKRQKSIAKKNQYVAATLYGKHGLRLDAEFAVNSILYQRFALFLKVYTHPVKVAAGAMIGKALSIELADKNSGLNESKIEFMSDEELELKLIESTNDDVRSLGQYVRKRHIYKPIFRSRVVPKEADWTQEKSHVYFLNELNIFDNLKRLKIEKELVEKFGIESKDFIIYCDPSAPGKKKFSQRVEVNKGMPAIRNNEYRWHIDMLKNHIGLWHIYGFINPNVPKEKYSRIAEELVELFGRENEIDTPQRQLSLF